MENQMVRKRTSVLRQVNLSALLSATLFSMSPLHQSQVNAQDIAGPPIDNAGWVGVGGDRIFYEDVGAGPAVILIHDGLVHREIWDAQMPVLSEHFRVIRYDRRGYGASPAPTEPFSNIDDLEALFEYLNVDEACLIAMSAGGRLAIDFALEHPEQVTSLILVGAVVSGFSYTRHFYDRGGHLPPGLSARERRAYYAADDPYGTFSENLAARRMVIELVGRYAEHGFQGSFSTPPEEPALGRLNEIAIPTLVLVGEFDIPDVHAHAGAINAGIRNSEREIIYRAGHLIPIEQPDSFNSVVLDFLNRVFR